jgi:glutaminyl-tRNA synthetase
LIVGDRPHQTEFARLNLSYTVISKRVLIELVEEGKVVGWDDPRMPTIAGMRRRGYTPESIRNFCAAIGVAKNDNLIDVSVLEHCVREDLNEKASRVMGVLRPLPVIIDNYPKEQTEEFEFANHPQNPEMGTRKVVFSKKLYIERDDFNENPPGKYKRLSPGGEVRLRNAYVIKYKSMVKDEKTGEIVELHCTYDPETRNAPPSDGRKIKGVIHWVSAKSSLEAEVRLYDRLFNVPDPARGGDMEKYLNPESLITLTSCRVESSLEGTEPGSRYQFERLGYFCVDFKDSLPGRLVFNRILPLRDSWGKIAAGAAKISGK